jgi:hypothetical protein
MEEGVARPIGEFDEAKPLLGIENLDLSTLVFLVSSCPIGSVERR